MLAKSSITSAKTIRNKMLAKTAELYLKVKSLAMS